MPTAKQTIDWYDENAESYAAHLKEAAQSPYHGFYEKPAIYSLLPKLSSKSVLSLGCGSGEDSAELKKRGAKRSVGIDISQGLISVAENEHPECEFVVGTMEDLPFTDSEFDLVYSSFALHYLPTYEYAFKEAFRVLKPGGILLFSVGHPLGPSMEVVIDSQEIMDKRLGILRDKKTKTKKIFGDYLSIKPFRTHIPQFDVTFWKQPISQTVTELVDAGFIIEKCVEAKPQNDMKKVAPDNYNLLMRIPDVIIFRARKPIS